MPNGTDISKFIASLDRELLPRVIPAGIRALDQWGAMANGRAANRAPIDKGNLRASHVEEPAKLEGTQITKVIGFNAVYAARQHEELDWNHPHGGEAKYLEQALRESLPRLAPLVIAQMSKAL